MLKTKKDIFSIFSILLFQFANYALPLFSLPYLSRTLGLGFFGKVSFFQSFVYYFSLIILYSFDITVTREIALNKDNKQKVKNIFSSATTARLYLFILSSIIYFSLVFSLKKCEGNYLDFFLAYLVNLGFVFTPTWFFLGIDDSVKVSIINFLVKSVFTIMILLLIKSPSDYIYVNFSQSVSQIIVAILFMWFVWYKYAINYKIANLKDTISLLNNGWDYFKTNLVITLYTVVNPIILGMFVNDIEVGIYSLTYKVVSVLSSFLIVPLNMFVYPKINVLFKENPLKAISLAFQILKVVIIVGIVIVGITFLSCEQIVLFLYKTESALLIKKAIFSLKIASLTILFIAISNIFGFQILMPMKGDRYLFYVCSVLGLISVALSYVVSIYFESLGMIIMWTITEFLILIGFAYFAMIKVNEYKNGL